MKSTVETLTVTFLARGKRYGKWEELQLKDVTPEETPDQILDGCKEFAGGYFDSEYVEVQNVSKPK